MASNDTQQTFNATESKLLVAFVENIQGSVAVDWEAVAKTCNLAHAKSARDQFNALRKKKMNGLTTIATTSKRKNGEEESADVEETAKPAKKPRKPRANKGTKGATAGAIGHMEDAAVKAENQDE